MTERKSVTIVLLIAFLLSGCEPTVENTQSETAVSVFANCENTFVVSGSRNIYLFEHQNQGVGFKQLAVFNDWAPLSAFLDCANRRIIVPYGARKEDRNDSGVAMIDLETGNKTEYPLVAKGIQGVPLKFGNGILLSTTLLNRSQPSQRPPAYGYLPPGERYVDARGADYRLFASTVFFDLSRLQFTRELDLDLGYSVIEDGMLYAQQRGAITAINLHTKTTDVLYESALPNNGAQTKKIPLNHLGVFLDAEYYMVLNRYSQNNSKGQLEGFEDNAVYKLEKGSMVKLANLAYDDAVYLLGLDSKLYIFTHSFKIIEYDLNTQEMVEREFPYSKEMVGYSIESVGYTHQNFILALDNQRTDISSKVILISRDFSQASAPKVVDLRLISVTSNLAIDTSDSRGIQLPVNQNSSLN